MNLSRRLRSFIIAIVATVVFLVLLQFFAANTSFKFIRPAHLGNSTSNSSFTFGPLSPYVPSSIWWTSETSMEPHFAYAQYATDGDYFCNSLINADRLFKFGATADVVIMYPTDWDGKPADSKETKMLAYAKTTFPELHLEPVHMVSTSKGDATWAHSLTKFNAFRLSNYSRVLYFDSDSLVLNNMDHYFLAPLSRLAVPRAYWLNDPDKASFAEQTIGSHIMLLQPDEYSYETIMNETKSSGDFDMEVINHLFKSSAMILPHRRIALLTGEFRTRDHRKYLSDEPDAEWNAMGEVSRSVLVHFSDWPLPKPWRSRTEQQWEAALPECNPEDDRDKELADRPPCADRMMWTGLYSSYELAKKNICEGKW